MKRIKLTQGQYALVDDADFDWLYQWKWYALKDRSCNSFRAVRRGKDHHQIIMARLMLGLEYGDKYEVDHKNRNPLDNRRDNLRICTHQENSRNRKSFRGTTSKYKGVYWEKGRKGEKWRATIFFSNKLIHIGYFTIEEEAARAYNEMAKEYFGKFACLNQINEKKISEPKFTQCKEGLGG